MENNNDTALVWILGILFGAVAVIWAGVVGTGSLVARAQCGSWPEETGPGAVLNFVQDGPAALETEAGCAPSAVGMGFLVVVVLVAVTAAVVVSILLWSRWKESDARFLQQLHTRDGVAKAREVNKQSGKRALLSKASTIRPTLLDPKPCDLGFQVGASQGQAVWISAEDSVVILGPPRSGKGFYLAINLLLDAPGAVLTTSTRGDNVRAVWEAREKVGPCALFDPQGLTKLETTLKWSPFQGCEKPMVAARRAQAIVGASSMGQSSSNQEWAGVATNILQWLLHAAALGEVDAPTLGRWGASPGLADEAVTILRESPGAAKGWADALSSELTGDPRMLPSKWMGVSSATSSLMLPEVADVLNPAPGEGLDPRTFIEQKGTLFLVGTKTGGGAAGPMLMALMDAITAEARQMAMRMPGNRLDPPLSLILDEIANLAPWKELPTIMSDGGGAGISTFVILQSPAQAKSAWGVDEAQQILDSATFTIQLGGSGNVDELKRLAELMGERQVRDRSKTWSNTGTSTGEQVHDKPVITVAELRRLPAGTGLLLARTARPIVLTMSKWIDRKDAEEIKAAIGRFDQRLLAALTAGTDVVAEPSQRRAQLTGR